MQGVRRSIEDFRGDYRSLASLLQRSWEENNQQALSYSPEFLKSFLTAPGADRSLAPSLYEADRLIGFASGFVRHVQYRGFSLKLITNSFLSVLPEYKKSGFGVVLWSELANRAREGGFDGMINFCIDGEPMNRMIEGCCRRLKLPVQRLFSIRYMSSLLKPSPSETAPDPPLEVTVSHFLSLAAPLLSSQPLARKWSIEEAKWQCLQRTGRITAHSSYGSRHGILNGYITSILDRHNTKCLLVEDVFWEELEPEERFQLLHRFLAEASSRGAQMASVPNLRYADLLPFKRMRFISTRRVLHCYLTLFDSSLPLKTVSSLYLDVF
jgi:GNAT superfamily N-acetyltransferase